MLLVAAHRKDDEIILLNQNLDYTYAIKGKLHISRYYDAVSDIRIQCSSKSQKKYGENLNHLVKEIAFEMGGELIAITNNTYNGYFEFRDKAGHELFPIKEPLPLIALQYHLVSLYPVFKENAPYCPTEYTCKILCNGHQYIGTYHSLCHCAGMDYVKSCSLNQNVLQVSGGMGCMRICRDGRNFILEYNDDIETSRVPSLTRLAFTRCTDSKIEIPNVTIIADVKDRLRENEFRISDFI